MLCKNKEHYFNKSTKLTQNTLVVFVVNLMVMTTFLGAGHSAWRANVGQLVPWTTGTMPFLSFVDNWDHPVMSRWTTGTI